MRAESCNLSSHHILLVEDHPSVLNATRMLLKSAGYRVTTATSLAEAIERTRDSPDLDLVITDYHLTGRSPKLLSSRVRSALIWNSFTASIAPSCTATMKTIAFLMLS